MNFSKCEKTYSFMLSYHVKLITECIKSNLLTIQIRPWGNAVSSLSFLCILSWRPFCYGLPSSMRSGRIPNFNHFLEVIVKPPMVLLAKGFPFSDLIACGIKNSLNTLSNTVYVCSTLVLIKISQASRKRYEHL